ncbi:MAG TPA: hypothetical protein EYO58_05915, partial [Flavobacteriales bacterium]|nr:hypothetical protein [Flavobacteriales bacterium]
LYWKNTRCVGDEVYLVHVEGREFILIEKMMRESWESAKIGQGRDGSGMTHDSFIILNVLRVENSMLWRKYSSLRFEIPSVQSSEDLLDISTDSEFSTHFGLDWSKNEKMLFHGAPGGFGDTNDVVEIITRSGFDERVSRRGMFGSGIYFASKSSKADCYSGRYQDSSIGERGKMMLSRVVMGNFHTTSTSCTDLRRPPCVKGHPKPCHHERCHSVYFDGTRKNYEEFIVYDRNQCYPEYVIEYERTKTG